MNASEMNYTRRLFVPVGFASEVGASDMLSHHMAASLDLETLDAALAPASGGMLMLGGGHRPMRDQFAALSLKQVGHRFDHNPMQANQAFRQYGELLGLELRALGYAILQVQAIADGQMLFADDAESNAGRMAAFWSGLRSEGVAINVVLPPDASGGVDWEQVNLTLISGAPFVTVDYAHASAELLHQLLNEQRFAGVACVAGLAASGLSGRNLLEEAVRLLDMGWHALLLDDLDGEAFSMLYQGLRDTGIGAEDSHQDAVARLSKRRSQLQAVEGRGAGFLSLDRDADYILKRRLLSGKLRIDDPYAFQERPARSGSMIRFRYRLFVDDELRDQSEADGMRVLLGKGQIIPGLERSLMGRRKGDRFRTEVPPEQGYGNVDASRILSIPRGGIMLAPGERLKPGGRAVIPRNGEALVGRILEVGDDEVRVDTNHELAGKALSFEIDVLDVM